MFHSYVLYPLLLKLFSLGKKPDAITYTEADSTLPIVRVIFAVYNEEKVISEKLNSIFNTSYPLEKLEVVIGSDNSTDRTNELIQTFAAKYKQITFVAFYERNGKSEILNKLVELVRQRSESKGDIYIFTDANVMFTPVTIYEAVKHFRNAGIGLVAANILNKGVVNDGISFQEKSYIQRENAVKYLEGLNWGSLMGAFGACYAVRAEYWPVIPENYLMEDFYVTMHVLALGKKAILEQDAVCVEDVSDEVGEEFKRKSRIQAGNFQNLGVYWPLLFRFNAVSFCFFSHKVIRWLGPLLILLAYGSNVLLLNFSSFYSLCFVLQNILLLSPVIDAVFKRLGWHLMPLRFASYFYMMNLALVNGFWMFAKGIRSNAWSPTKRNV
jgi:cellulose synthase/poly-beta-1,6-N-acetylglucosamine synthase-like glycosyltransferase